jgi:hypothetical protein
VLAFGCEIECDDCFIVLGGKVTALANWGAATDIEGSVTAGMIEFVDTGAVIAPVAATKLAGG